jgi:hypothetical protein
MNDVYSVDYYECFVVDSLTGEQDERGNPRLRLLRLFHSLAMTIEKTVC